MAEKYGNADAVGLVAYGVTAFCLMIITTDALDTPGSMTMVIGLGIFFGGLVEIVAGILDWRAGSTFGAVAFLSFGAFWVSYCVILMSGFQADTGAGAAGGTAMGVYMLAWLIFIALMFVATLKLLPILRLIFFTAIIVFALLTVAQFAAGAEVDFADTVSQIAGVVGIILGAEAIYGGVALVVNEVYGEEYFPVGTAYMEKKAAEKESA